jgi:hypothetical protein
MVLVNFLSKIAVKLHKNPLSSLIFCSSAFSQKDPANLKLAGVPKKGYPVLVHPIPGPLFNTGISVLKNINTGNTGIISVLKHKKKIDQIIRNLVLGAAQILICGGKG